MHSLHVHGATLVHYLVTWLLLLTVLVLTHLLLHLVHHLHLSLLVHLLLFHSRLWLLSSLVGKLLRTLNYFILDFRFFLSCWFGNNLGLLLSLLVQRTHERLWLLLLLALNWLWLLNNISFVHILVVLLEVVLLQAHSIDGGWLLRGSWLLLAWGCILLFGTQLVWKSLLLVWLLNTFFSILLLHSGLLSIVWLLLNLLELLVHELLLLLEVVHLLKLELLWSFIVFVFGLRIHDGLRNLLIVNVL